MGIPGVFGVKGERGPSGPKGDTGPPGKLHILTNMCTPHTVSLYFLSPDLSVLQVYLVCQATGVLLHFPSKYQGREAFQGHRGSEDQMGVEGPQGHRALLEMQVNYCSYRFVVEHLYVICTAQLQTCILQLSRFHGTQWAERHAWDQWQTRGAWFSWRYWTNGPPWSAGHGRCV